MHTLSPTVAFIRAARAGDIPAGSFDPGLISTGPLTEEELGNPALRAAVEARSRASADYTAAIRVKPAASGRARDVAAYERRLERAINRAAPLLDALRNAERYAGYVRAALNLERQPHPGFREWWHNNPLRALYLGAQK